MEAAGGRTAESDVGADGTDQKADESSERTYVHDGVADKSESGAERRAGGLQEFHQQMDSEGFDDGETKPCRLEDFYRQTVLMAEEMAVRKMAILLEETAFMEAQTAVH